MNASSPQLREEFESKTLQELANEMAYGPTSNRYNASWAELCRRQASWQHAAASAQTSSAKYMLWTVVAIAITSASRRCLRFSCGTRLSFRTNRTKLTHNRTVASDACSRSVARPERSILARVLHPDSRNERQFARHNASRLSMGPHTR